MLCFPVEAPTLDEWFYAKLFHCSTMRGYVHARVVCVYAHGRVVCICTCMCCFRNAMRIDPATKYPICTDLDVNSEVLTPPP